MTNKMTILKRYVPYLALGPAANFMWAFWALPDIHETGTLAETLEWICVQALVPVLFGVLVTYRRRYVCWMLIVYGGFMALFSFGILGWALMGVGTPLSVYAVCFALMVMGFGVLYHAMKDLDFGPKETFRDLEG